MSLRARLGTDLAPNALELLLPALGACPSAGFINNAALQGIAILMLTIEVEGRIDLARFLELPVDKPAGYTEIRGGCRIDAAATPSALAAVASWVIATSPATDTFRRPIPANLTVNGEPVG
jgi:hypothetical protein